MDLAEIKRLALAAREFTVTVGPAAAPRVLSLRVPTQHEVTMAARRGGLDGVTEDRAAHVVLERVLLAIALVGWQGVTVADVLPDAAPDAGAALLPWEEGATDLLLDAQPEWARLAGTDLLARMAKRKQVRDTAKKNLPA
jgi:hypothetical protein